MVSTSATTGLTAEEFGELYIQRIGCRFGLPESIVTDHDPRWTSDFWKGVAKYLKTKMSLSSSHHLQHDGQTEIVNKQLVTMLRAYINNDLDNWAAWLHILEFAYNNSVHSSTGTTPFFLLYGFHPWTLLDFLNPSNNQGMNYSLSEEAVNFLETLAMHRDSARRSIAAAQDRQATQYNKSWRPVPEFKKGSQVLVNPHSLEWVDSKGAGSKLKQRWIGPFEVVQRINPKVYRLRMSDRYPGLPVFNIEHHGQPASAPSSGNPSLSSSSRAIIPDTQDSIPFASQRWLCQMTSAGRRSVSAEGESCERSASVTHYLCVKCRELSMKVVWRAGMAMV